MGDQRDRGLGVIRGRGLNGPADKLFAAVDGDSKCAAGKRQRDEVLPMVGMSCPDLGQLDPAVDERPANDFNPRIGSRHFDFAGYRTPRNAVGQQLAVASVDPALSDLEAIWPVEELQDLQT